MRRFSSRAGPPVANLTQHPQYFDTRRQILDTFETQLRSLLISLAAAAKARHGLQDSLSELQSAFLGLAQCDLSGPLRKALERGAAVQKRLWELSEEQTISEEQIGGLMSVAEGYARLCASARVSHILPLRRPFDCPLTCVMYRRVCSELVSRLTTSGKLPNRLCGRPRRHKKRLASRVVRMISWDCRFRRSRM